MKNSLLQCDKYKMDLSITPYCTQCNIQKQETLQHFIFVCPKYNNIRRYFIQNIKSLSKLKYIRNYEIITLLNNNNSDNLLHNTEYKTFLKFVKNYIIKTKRFA